MSDPLSSPKDVIIIMQWYDFVPASLYIDKKVNLTMFNKMATLHLDSNLFFDHQGLCCF